MRPVRFTAIWDLKKKISVALLTEIEHCLTFEIICYFVLKSLSVNLILILSLWCHHLMTMTLSRSADYEDDGIEIDRPPRLPWLIHFVVGSSFSSEPDGLFYQSGVSFIVFDENVLFLKLMRSFPLATWSTAVEDFICLASESFLVVCENFFPLILSVSSRRAFFRVLKSLPIFHCCDNQFHWKFWFGKVVFQILLMAVFTKWKSVFLPSFWNVIYLSMLVLGVYRTDDSFVQNSTETGVESNNHFTGKP